MQDSFLENLSKGPMKPKDWANVGTGLLIGISSVFTLLLLVRPLPRATPPTSRPDLLGSL
jgi:hypothetical protein